MHHPKQRHARTQMKSPRAEQVTRPRARDTENYQRLFLNEILNTLKLIEHAEDYRTEYNTKRPHKTTTWPPETHLDHTDPNIPNLDREETLPTA